MEENISMYRICRKCGRKLPLSEFAKNKNCKYGRTYTCYECSKRKYHENYLRKLEKEGCKPYWENKNLISFPGEIWKPICGYEGEYDVSNFGRIKSRDRFRKNNSIGDAIVRQRILKPMVNLHGYLYVNLCSGGVRKVYLVHRLVAIMFIPNPLNLPQVNHKDENKKNNSVENLEWCNAKYNNNYGTGIERCSKKRLNLPSLSKKVGQYDINNNLIQVFPSLSEAARYIHKKKRHIWGCCLGESKTAYGYKWKYI